MKVFSASPLEILRSLREHRQLLRMLIVREVVGRYKGSYLGLFWALFYPVFMLCVYTFVFGLVFKSRWSGVSESKSEFALVMFVGLMVFNIFAENINRAPQLIISNVNFVKKVVFPLELLACVSLGSSLFHAGVSMLVWLGGYLLVFGTPPITGLLLPVVLLPLVPLVLGCSWILASLGVYLRDVSQVVGIMTTAVMFLSPIFFPVSALPEEFQFLMDFNPLSVQIENARNVLMWGLMPDFAALSRALVVGCVIAVGGFAWFQKTRKGFADVL